MLRLLSFAFALLLCTTAVASSSFPLTVLESSGTTFVTEAINTSVCTSIFSVNGLDTVNFDLNYVYNSATQVKMTCKYNNLTGAAAEAWFDINTEYYLGADSYWTPRTWYRNVTASAKWPWPVEIVGYQYLQCCFITTGGAASDTLTLTGRGVAR